MQDRPNILWICTDQQRADLLGCYGSSAARTPNLDALAAGGVTFTNAYCQSPICSPSRGSFMTGRYPQTCRLRQNGQALPADEVLVTRRFRDAGYRCGLAGKLHLSPCSPVVVGGGAEARLDDGYEVFHWHHDHWVWSEYGEFARAKGVDPGAAFEALPQCPHVQIGPSSDATATAWAGDCAQRFIRESVRDGRPWLFSLNLFDPHHPFRIPGDRIDAWRERLNDESIAGPRYTPGELEEKPIWQAIDHQGAYGGRGMSFANMEAMDHRWIRAAYLAMVENIDETVGRLIDTLEETGQRENTLIVFMSDHGEMLGDHGIYLKGPYFYEELSRVPLVMSLPGTLPSGQRRGGLVELIDLAPTLLDLVGLDHHEGMQGRSLLDWLRNADMDAEFREDVTCHFQNANFRYEPPAHTTMLRTARWKLTRAHSLPPDGGGVSGELYDLEADPRETTNLWRDPAYREIRAELLARLADRLALAADPLPARQAMW